MVIEIDNKKYYTATEVCQEAGISRPTLFRWIQRGVIQRLHKNRRGWRLFTEDDLKNIKSEVIRIDVQELA